MLISLNEIKKLVDIPKSISTDELVRLIGSRLVEVEGTKSLAEIYDGCVIAKVVSAEPIPETHLHLCKIDAGAEGQEFAEDFAKKNPDAALTTNEDLVQVVCGAPNVHAGMFAVWIKPGAIVPETYGGENFKLSVRKLRGYESYGMLAGADELGFDTEHKFIAEIDPKTTHAGQKLTDRFDLDDVILDIENKSLTHRPDTFGLIGFAREVAGILGIKFNEPAADFGGLNISLTNAGLLNDFTKLQAETAKKHPGPSIEVNVTDDALCTCYSAMVFDVKNSTLDSATEKTKYLDDNAIFLAKAGMRSISKIVDATNIVMLLTGQPLHAFDYDKFVAVGGAKDSAGELKASITVRAGKPGETLKLLDDKTIDLLPTDIVITSNDVPVALAGAMGGESTEIDDSTKRVILESATFSLYNERKMQMAHGIFSEAITRFTKGQPTVGTIPAALACTRMILASPEQIISSAYCRAVSDIREDIVKLSVDDINSLLGTAYGQKLIIKTLENVGFTVAEKGSVLTVTAPAWRTDIHIKQDVIEEIGRLLGFDNIAKVFPTREFRAAGRNRLMKLKTEIRSCMSDRLGANELLTYSFVSSALQEKVGEDPEDSYEIVNSISPELQRFRQTIVPSLLDKTRDNLKAGFKNFSLYEFNQVTKKSYGLNDEKVPVMKWHFAAVTHGDFYQAKALLMALAGRLHITLEVAEFADGPAYFEPLHSAVVKSGDITLGYLGEIKAKVLKNLKVDDSVSAFELDLALLEEAPRLSGTASRVSRFPSVERDLTAKVGAAARYADVYAAIEREFQKLPNLIFRIEPVSIYRESDTAKTKNLSFRFVFSSTEKTLESGEISAIMKNIEGAVKKLGAEVV